MIALNTKVVLEQINAQETTASGFILTGGSENKQLKVVSTGEGLALPLRGKLKDAIVYIDWKNATKIRHDAKDYVVVDYNDIVAMI